MSSKQRTRAVRRAAAGGAVLAVVTFGQGGLSPAAAAPPHGEGGHTHHVDTGNGGCVAVSPVAFFAESRGLHRGGNASGVGRGPEHGPCAHEGS